MKCRLALAVLAAAAIAAPAALADNTGSHAPIQNGCPAGYHILSVADLTNEGYGVPAALDVPADGLICAKRVSEALAVQLCGGEHGPDATCPVPIVYDFVNNS